MEHIPWPLRKGPPLLGVTFGRNPQVQLWHSFCYIGFAYVAYVTMTLHR